MLLKSNDFVRIYLDEVKEYPLLKPQEERGLAEKIMAGKAVREKIERKREEGLDEDSVKAFIKDNKLETTLKEGRNAFEKMVNSNLRLVVHIAKAFRGRSPHLKFLDLIQEGSIGLIRAVEGFDLERDCRLSTYATHWIKQSLDRAIRTNGDDIRIPIYLSLDLSNFKKTHKKLSLKLGRKPTQKEISKEIKFSSKSGSRAKKTASLDVLNNRHFNSLYASIPGADSLLIDFIKDETVGGPAELYEKENTKNLIRGVIDATLNDKETEVINLRFGLSEDHGENSLEEIGKILGVTRERVRQIEVRALEKMGKRLKNLKVLQ